MLFKKKMITVIEITIGLNLQGLMLNYANKTSSFMTEQDKAGLNDLNSL